LIIESISQAKTKKIFRYYGYKKMRDSSDNSDSNSNDDEKKKITESLWVPESRSKLPNLVSSNSEHEKLSSNVIQRQAQRLLESYLDERLEFEEIRDENSMSTTKKGTEISPEGKRSAVKDNESAGLRLLRDSKTFIQEEATSQLQHNQRQQHTKKKRPREVLATGESDDDDDESDDESDKEREKRIQSVVVTDISTLLNPSKIQPSAPSAYQQSNKVNLSQPTTTTTSEAKTAAAATIGTIQTVHVKGGNSSSKHKDKKHKRKSNEFRN